MNAAEDQTVTSHNVLQLRRWYRFSRLEYAIFVLMLLLLGHMLLGSYAGYRHRHTCVICRLERIDYNWNYWPHTSAYNDTTCSQWYQSHVEPAHDHVWSANSSLTMLNFYVRPVGAGDNENRPGRAIWRLTPNEQIAIYKHFPNPLDAKTLFVSLVEPEVMQDRHDIGIVYSLRQWMESGFLAEWKHPDDEHDPAPGLARPLPSMN